MVTPAKEQEYLTKIHTQEAVIEQLKKELELHSKQNDLLQQQVNALTEILIQMRKDKFGSKSEKTKVLDNQLNFFNEPELCADLKETEPIVKIGKKGVSVRARKVREEALKDLPVEVHEYDLPDNEMTCPQCSHTLKKIGSQFVRNIIKYIPAQIAVERLMQYSPCILYAAFSGFSRFCCRSHYTEVCKQRSFVPSGRDMEESRHRTQQSYNVELGDLRSRELSHAYSGSA